MPVVSADRVLETAASEDRWITAAPLLNGEQCLRVRESLDRLRPQWIKRHATRPFFTLGAANYFDISRNALLPYYRMAARLNPVLREELGWLYEQLREHLEARLEAPVVYREGLALPGFHIFLSDEAFQQPVDMTHSEWYAAKGKKDVVGNAIHCDTAHKVVNWAGSTPDCARPLSVTVPIEMPGEGAGLNYWGFGEARTQGIPTDELRGYLLSQRRDYFPYRIGEVILHDGLRYHQMAAMPGMQPDEARITLQGHGAMVDGVWQFFW